MPVFLLSATCTLLYLTCVLFFKSAKCDLFQSPSLPGGGRWVPLVSTHNRSGRRTCLVCRYQEWGQHARAEEAVRTDSTTILPQQPLYLAGSFLKSVWLLSVCYSTQLPAPTGQSLLLSLLPTERLQDLCPDDLWQVYLQTPLHPVPLNLLCS